ncbi:MAG: hypothetical protein ACO3JL_07715 [Myxococcota bacterium]
MNRTRASLAFVVVLSVGCIDTSATKFVLVASGLESRDLLLETRPLGTPERVLLEARLAAGDVDGAALLPDDACGGPCRSVELTLFVQNRTSAPAAPPVVRLSSPEGRAPRPPVVFQAEEISPGRSGRIRWLMSLWPEEQRVEVRPSASVFFEVFDAAAGTQPSAAAAKPLVENMDTAVQVPGTTNPGRRHAGGQ